MTPTSSSTLIWVLTPARWARLTTNGVCAVEGPSSVDWPLNSGMSGSSCWIALAAGSPPQHIKTIGSLQCIAWTDCWCCLCPTMSPCIGWKTIRPRCAKSISSKLLCDILIFLFYSILYTYIHIHIQIHYKHTNIIEESANESKPRWKSILIDWAVVHSPLPIMTFINVHLFPPIPISIPIPISTSIWLVPGTIYVLSPHIYFTTRCPPRALWYSPRTLRQIPETVASAPFHWEFDYHIVCRVEFLQEYSLPFGSGV